jgi:acyl transferase domain-containing protein
MLEVGPGRTLTSLARQHPDSRRHTCIATLPHPNDPTSGRVTALNALGRLWSIGASIAWQAVHDGELRRRVPLPTYEFDRKRCAITRRVGESAPGEMSSTLPSDLPDTIEPATTHAQQVAATFAAVLGISDAAPNDNFFDLGGDSLMAAQLVQKLRSTFPGLTLTPRSVFKAPTVAALTRLVAEQHIAAERQELA